VKRIGSIEEMRAACARAAAGGSRLGFVPTMGFLHAGHMSLVSRSRAECAATAVSIFVNPLQFGPGEDLATYPRDVERDAALLEEAGVDLLFLPEPGSFYSGDHATYVEVEGLSSGMCGVRRPGHFRGVATVVAKLFNVVRPAAAYFGQKDWQQAMIITKMASDLGFGIDIVVCPTVREEDGLALSSRNSYLSASERAAAPALYRALAAAREIAARGAADAARLAGAVRESLSETQLELEYVEVREARTLKPVTRPEPGSELVVAAAARLGRTRLIDNVVFRTITKERGRE